MPTGEGGRAQLTVDDLIAGLGQSKDKLGASRKLLEKLGSKATPVSAPLPRLIKERSERKGGYEHTKQDITKWQPIVKVGPAHCMMHEADGRACRSGLSFIEYPHFWNGNLVPISVYII